MIDAEDMAVGLKVTVEGMGTLVLVEPVGRCPHTPPQQVEQVRSISGRAAYEVQRERNRGRFDDGTRMPIWDLLDEKGCAFWENVSIEVREIIEVAPRTELVGSKSLDPVERWTAVDEEGVLRVVDCHLCEVAP